MADLQPTGLAIGFINKAAFAGYESGYTGK